MHTTCMCAWTHLQANMPQNIIEVFRRAELRHVAMLSHVFDQGDEADGMYVVEISYHMHPCTHKRARVHPYIKIMFNISHACTYARMHAIHICRYVIISGSVDVFVFNTTSIKAQAFKVRLIMLTCTQPRIYRVALAHTHTHTLFLAQYACLAGVVSGNRCAR